MSQGRPTSSPLPRAEYDAVLLDLDGVITDTARIHAQAWKVMFDEYLRAHAARAHQPFRPFEIHSDYALHVDGKSRADGVRDFLKSRGILLPDGTADDPPLRETVCGLGNRKNALLNETISTGGVAVYPDSVDLLHKLQACGFKMAVVTSSQNCASVLNAAGLAEMFDLQIDGNVIRDRHLAGKPAADAFLSAAKALQVAPSRAVVVEDAISGVQAGRNGKFGLVVGVARTGNHAELKRHGADIVVSDLAELRVEC